MTTPQSQTRRCWTLAGIILFGPGFTREAWADQPNKEPHSVSSRSAPTKDFRLFVGVDIKAFWGDDFATVTDFVNNRARLDSTDEPALPLERLERIGFEHKTKLSRFPIEFGEIETELTSGTDAEIREQMKRQSALQSYADDQIDILNQDVADSFGKPSGEQVQPDGTVVDFGDPSGEAVTSLNNFTANYSSMSNPAFHTSNLARDAEGRHNSLIIKTTITSPQPIADAYLVGLARINTLTDGIRDVIFFRELGFIGPTPKQLRIRKDNMPEGFELKNLTLHIYREGQEIASGMSEKQFALTREEALDYLTLARISSNRGKTLPAEPAWSLAPSELLASERPRDFDFPLTVHVDAKGRVTRVDESTIVPDQISQIVGELMFFPAIENGTAIDSVAQINLRDFFR
ncbi:hypothetical protein N9K67_00935 [Opitutaceae bacterium]|nr:hypothetical protein [Opitutaceae bacterium]